MIKCDGIIRILLFILISFQLSEIRIHSQEKGDFYDSCRKEESKKRNIFDGKLLYGEHGATSQLERKKSFKKYNPENAFDGKIETSWVEGAADEGKGEILAFYSSSINEKIGILPGYGTQKHFKLNNRIKTAKLEIYSTSHDIDQCSGLFFEKGELLYSGSLNFRDSMDIQFFPINLTNKSDDGYLVTIEILSVYRGNKYNDTCIAEVVLK